MSRMSLPGLIERILYPLVRLVRTVYRGEEKETMLYVVREGKKLVEGGSKFPGSWISLVLLYYYDGRSPGDEGGGTLSDGH